MSIVVVALIIIIPVALILGRFCSGPIAKVYAYPFAIYPGKSTQFYSNAVNLLKMTTKWMFFGMSAISLITLLSMLL